LDVLELNEEDRLDIEVKVVEVASEEDVVMDVEDKKIEDVEQVLGSKLEDEELVTVEVTEVEDERTKEDVEIKAEEIIQSDMMDEEVREGMEIAVEEKNIFEVVVEEEGKKVLIELEAEVEDRPILYNTVSQKILAPWEQLFSGVKGTFLFVVVYFLFNLLNPK